MDTISEKPAVAENTGNDASFPPKEPPAFLLPHMQQFSAVFKTPARTYRWSFDEALKRSRTDAIAMRRDGHILHLLQARYLPLLGAAWSVKSEDDEQKETASIYQKLIERTPRLLQLRKYLLEAVWYGRSGVQLAFGKVNVEGREMTGITAWRPVNGDKISFREDGTPCIRINPAFASKLKAEGGTVMSTSEMNDIVSWSDQGTVLILDKPSFRQRFLIHVHEIEDADYNEPELAGGVAGVGLRHYCYWIWWLRQEMMEWLLSYLELIGAGGITIVYYDAANPKGLEQAQAAFTQRATVAFLPKPAGSEQQTNMIQRIEPSGVGNDIFNQWIDGYFNGILTKLIIGQDLSSQSSATGMGSGVADLQADTKEAIHRYDAKNLNETESQQLLQTLIELNDPQSGFSFKCETAINTADPDKALMAANQAFAMGAELPESYVLQLANIPKPKEGERVLSQIAMQLAQQNAAAMAPPATAEDDSGGDGQSLDEMRGMLEEQGIPEDEQLHELADRVDAGELIETDGEGGARYQEPVEMLMGLGEEPQEYAKADWTETTGARGAKYWTNTKTGTVQYREPKDREPAKSKATTSGGSSPAGAPVVSEKQQANNQRASAARTATYQKMDQALQGKGKITDGESVLAHIREADKGLLKPQAIALAMQHGMPASSMTNKARALAFIEDKLRGQMGVKNDDGTGTGEKQQAGNEAAGTAGSAEGDQQQAAAPESDRGTEGSVEAGGAGTETDATGSHHTLIAQGIQKSGLKPEQAKAYAGSAQKMYEAMPAKARERYDQHVKAINFHSTTSDLTKTIIEKSDDPEALKERIGTGKASGCFRKSSGELFLDGDGDKLNQDHIYAHEFAHAVDGPKNELSSTKEWQDAWTEEAAGISNYATRTPAEGFAEFGRMVHASGLDETQLTERFPKMMEHWKQQGLLPDAMAGTSALAPEGTPQLADVFEEPIETPTELGDKALHVRQPGQSLKDHLESMGAGSAYNDIMNAAKYRHGQELATGNYDQHNAVVKRAAELITNLSGKKFTSAHPAMKTGDFNSIDSFDVAHQAIASDPEFKGFISDDIHEGQKKLMGMLQEGIKSKPKLRDFEDKALQDWHDAGRPLLESKDSAEEGNTDFDFGANVALPMKTGTIDQERKQWEQAKTGPVAKKFESQQQLTAEQLHEKWYGVKSTPTTTNSSPAGSTTPSTPSPTKATPPPIEIPKTPPIAGHSEKQDNAWRKLLKELAMPENHMDFEEPVIQLQRANV